MAKQCSRCNTKIGLLSRKGWDINEDGVKHVLCGTCCADARRELEKHHLSQGYSQIRIRPFPHMPLEIPSICVVCGAPITNKVDCRKQNISLKRTRHLTPMESQRETLTTSVASCPRCSGLGLIPKQFIRIRFEGDEDVLVEIGDEQVATQFRDSIDTQMKRAGEVFQSKELEAKDEFERMRYYSLKSVAEICGVKSITRINS